MNKQLGIIQSRGLGDIIIALPIAEHYTREGYEVHWCIAESWVEQMQSVAAYVHWHPVKPDHGAFFYDIPQDIYRKLGITETLCLYNSLTGHPEFMDNPYFQHVSFDQFKYLKAGVAFEKKWNLKNCITRNAAREQALYDSLEIETPYVMTHLTSSQMTVRIPDDLIPPEYRIIPITDQGYIWDWLTAIERADAIIMTDSVMSNLVDQLNIPVEKYYIPQHHIQLTPVHLSDWIWLDNPDLKPHCKIFKSS